jgi:hypothetical protein
MIISNRIIKYILIGILTFISIRYLPTNALIDQEIIAIALIISIGYAIMDKLLPSYQY